MTGIDTEVARSSDGPGPIGDPADMTPAQRRRRRQILLAAEQLFAENRFDEVLMDDVAREAGVGKGTIYRYFTDKETLYFAVVGEGFTGLLQQIRCAAGTAAPRARLERTVVAIVEFLSRNRFVFRLMGRDEGEGCRRRDFRQAWKGHRAQLVEAVTDVLRQGAAAGAFDVRHPSADAQILLGMIRACLRFNEESLSPTQIVAETLRVFLAGITVPSGETTRAPDNESRTHLGETL